MSFKFTALALDHGPTDPLCKLVLMALCDRANEKAVCWPSRADLLARCNVSAATLSRKLRALESGGWIQRKQRFNSSSVFRINVLRLYEKETAAVEASKLVLPDGFEPFEEEQRIGAQPIENKGDAHCEHTDAHSEHTDAHCASSNLSINQSKTYAVDASALKGAKPRRAQRAAPNASGAFGGNGAAKSVLMDTVIFDLFMKHKYLGETRAEFLERYEAGNVEKRA